MSGESALRTLEEMARFFSITLPTARGWVVNKGCPVVERGGKGKPYQVDLRAVAEWRDGLRAAEREERERKAAQDEQMKLELFGDDRLEEPDEMRRMTPAEREAWHRSELHRIKIAEARDELVNAEELQLQLAAAGTLLRDRLRALPETLADAAHLDDDQVAAVAETIDAALEDLSETLSTMGKPNDLAAAA